jgi:hypothetical protein
MLEQTARLRQVLAALLGLAVLLEQAALPGQTQAGLSRPALAPRELELGQALLFLVISKKKRRRTNVLVLVLVLQTWQMLLVVKNRDTFEVSPGLYGARLRDILCGLRCGCLLTPFETSRAASQGLTMRHGRKYRTLSEP